MERFKQFATHHPVIFGLMFALILILLHIVSIILGIIIPGEAYGKNIGEAVGRLAATFLLLLIIWRLGWLKDAGFTRFGGWQSWLLILIPLIYEIIVSLYLFFGDFIFDLSDPPLVSLVTFNQITVGLVEETVFRGIILYSLIRLWGDSKVGIFKCALISALIFGASHMVWIITGRAVTLALLRALSTFLSGIYYAAFLLRGRSIWPLVVFHGVLNAVANVKVLGIAGFEETITSNVLWILLILPIVIFGIYLLWRVPPRRVIPDAA